MNVRSKFRIVTILLMSIVTAQFVITVVTTSLFCHGPTFYWKTPIMGKCIPTAPFYLQNCIFTIVSDIVILILPLHLLYKANLNTRTKIGLVAVFSASMISTISSCVRLNAIVIFAFNIHRGKEDYDATVLWLWSLIEINMTIVCASGPSLRQLFKHIKENSTSQKTGNAPDMALDGELRRKSMYKNGADVMTLTTTTNTTVHGGDAVLRLSQDECTETVCTVGSTMKMVEGPEVDLEANATTVSTFLVKVKSASRGSEKLEN